MARRASRSRTPWVERRPPRQGGVRIAALVPARPRVVAARAERHARDTICRAAYAGIRRDAPWDGGQSGVGGSSRRAHFQPVVGPRGRARAREPGRRGPVDRARARFGRVGRLPGAGGALDELRTRPIARRVGHRTRGSPSRSARADLRRGGTCAARGRGACSRPASTAAEQLATSRAFSATTRRCRTSEPDDARLLVARAALRFLVAPLGDGAPRHGRSVTRDARPSSHGGLTFLAWARPLGELAVPRAGRRGAPRPTARSGRALSAAREARRLAREGGHASRQRREALSNPSRPSRSASRRPGPMGRPPWPRGGSTSALGELMTAQFNYADLLTAQALAWYVTSVCSARSPRRR